MTLSFGLLPREFALHHGVIAGSPGINVVVKINEQTTQHTIADVRAKYFVCWCLWLFYVQLVWQANSSKVD